MSNYLVIYDVRGIQKYIFRSNKLKEISGASTIVRDLLPNLLKQELGNQIRDEWKKYDSFDFLDDEDIKAEIIYVGGGNLVLAYRGSEDELVELNKKIQIEFIEKTYSLSLAYSYVDMTDVFKTDLDNVKAKLNLVKQRMPQLVLTPACPIVDVDQYTSQVLTNIYLDRKISRESYLKLKAYEAEGNKFIDSIAGKTNGQGNALERKADKTMIAVIHIDGNDLGQMINKFYDENKVFSYKKAIELSRNVSKTIENAFNSAIYNTIPKDADYRVIVNSGDDITFICKAEKAIVYSKRIIEKIEEKNLGSLTFSACGGIAYVHSHFPFSRAYEIAEECCGIAKKKAKSPENMVNGRATSFIDYEICQAGILHSIDELRERNKNLYIKPYAVSSSLADKPYHINGFLKLIKEFKAGKLSRTAVKELRDSYQLGSNQANLSFERIKSKNKDYLSSYSCYEEIDGNDVATFYDMSSMIDLVDLMEEQK